MADDGSFVSTLGRVLGGVGEALSAPRRAVWGALGLPEHGKDLFKFMGDGFVPGALGFGAEVLGDPLTYLGGALASRAANALRPTAALGRASKPAASLAVNPVVREAGEQVPTFWGAQLHGGLEPGLPGALEGKLAYSATGDEGMSLVADVTGGLAGGDPVAKLNSLRGALSGTDDLAGFNALYDNAGKAIYQTAPKPLAEVAGSRAAQSALASRRHERMHSLVDAARGAPELRSALPLTGRVASRLADSRSPLLRGLGSVADEMAAHGAESRGLLGSLQNQAGFLFNPATNASYLGQIGAVSPAAARIYGALPGAFVGSGALGAHGLGEAAAGLWR